MAHEAARNENAGWRVLVVTMVQGGIVYHDLSRILPPLGHKIVGVLTSPGPARRRSRHYLDVAAAVDPNIDVLISNHPSRWAAMLAPLRPDLIITCGMPWRLPADLLALPRLGAINIHAALLPRWRGPSPLESMIRAGDEEIGLTIHRMAADFDNGAILAQARAPFAETDDIDTVFATLSGMSPGVVTQALERVARGEPGEPQDESLATYAPLPDETWEPIDWGRPAREIHNQVRALTIMGASLGGRATLDGQPVRVSKTRRLPSEPNGGEPGAVLRREGETLVVQCGDGPLAILAWTPETAG